MLKMTETATVPRSAISSSLIRFILSPILIFCSGLRRKRRTASCCPLYSYKDLSSEPFLGCGEKQFLWRRIVFFTLWWIQSNYFCSGRKEEENHFANSIRRLSRIRSPCPRRSVRVLKTFLQVGGLLHVESRWCVTTHHFPSKGLRISRGFPIFNIYSLLIDYLRHRIKCRSYLSPSDMKVIVNWKYSIQHKFLHVDVSTYLLLQCPTILW